MGVDLSGGDVSVTQQGLHAAQIGSMLHHVGGATVAQFMWAGGAVLLLYQLPDPLPGERLAPHTEKQSPFQAASLQPGTAFAQVMLQRFHGLTTKRHNAFLVAL